MQTLRTPDARFAGLAAYDAPFPDDAYCTGPRAMPGLLPTLPDDPASGPNRRAWHILNDSPAIVRFLLP